MCTGCSSPQSCWPPNMWRTCKSGISSNTLRLAECVCWCVWSFVQELQELLLRSSWGIGEGGNEQTGGWVAVLDEVQAARECECLWELLQPSRERSEHRRRIPDRENTEVCCGDQNQAQGRKKIWWSDYSPFALIFIIIFLLFFLPYQIGYILYNNNKLYRNCIKSSFFLFCLNRLMIDVLILTIWIRSWSIYFSFELYYLGMI